MSGRAQTADRAAWRRLLSLGERLFAQPTLAAQHDLIVETAARLLEAQATLWLAEAFYRLPGAQGLPSPLQEPPSDLMRCAFDSRRMCSGGEAGAGAAQAVAIPLLAGATTLGVLEVKRAGGPPFSEPEVELMDCLAAQSAVALQAARQVTVERWRATQLALVCRVSAQVAAILELDELARRVTDLILTTFKYYYVALFTLESGQETLRHQASAGAAYPQARQGKVPLDLQVRLGEGIIGHVAQTGTEIVANDVSLEPRYRAVDALPETRSEVALPLKVEERVLGVLDVQSDQAGAFDETDMVVLRALADQIAIAVEDARIYRDRRRRAEQLSAVAEVSRAVTSILDLDALLNEVVTLIHEKFGYPYVYLFTTDLTRGQIVYRAGTGPPDQALQARELVCSLDESEGIVPWVACHGETVLANDVSRDPRYRQMALPLADARAELAVPLTFGGNVLGVLDVQSERPNAFSEDDRFLFQALADSVAIAVRNANLYYSERWRRQVADSLREVAGLLSTNMALDQLLDAILTELERTLPCDVAAIWLLEHDSLCLSAVHGYGAEMCIRSAPSDAGDWLNRALNADQPVIRSPQSSAEPLGAILGFPPDYSAIAVPLRAGDRRLGVLTLAHRSPGRYGSEARMITVAFASYAAVAIENTRLYQEAQEQAWISTVMLQVAEATQTLTTLDQVLDTVVRLAPLLVGVDRCAILLWDEPGGTFVPAAAHGLTPAQQEAFDRWPVAPGEVPAFERLRIDKAPIVIHDTATDAGLAETAAAASGFRSLLLLPLLAHGEAVGAMLIDHQGSQAEVGARETFHEGRMAIIQGIAHQAAAAIESARLLEAQQEEAYVSAALLQVAQTVVSMGNLDDILSTIVRIVPLLVGVERCAAFLWNAEQSVFRLAQVYGVSRAAEAALLARHYAPGDFPLLDAVREHDRLATYAPGASAGGSNDEDNLAPPEFVADFGLGFVEPSAVGLHSLLAVPFSVKGDVLGAMVLEEANTPRHSRERRLEIITGIAHQAALAVQNDRLQREMAERERLERELQLAHEIQQTFMPGQSPALPGWELAFAWRAARQVAGDFYDFFKLSDGRLGLVIADVADKGMPAALFMALTRTLMRAAALEERSPAAALARVNDLLVPDAQQGMFVTAIYAILSLGAGELTYANAGHNLPLVLRSGTRGLERLNKGGMALGVLEGIRLEEHVVSLEPGDSVVFYTDGITEAFSSQGDIYSEERLQATIQAANGGSAQTILDAIDASVVAFAGDTAPSDDRTLMVLRRTK